MSDALDNTTWTLSAPLEAPEGVGITISFHDGMASGYAGCNRFHGGYRLTGDDFTMGPLASTRMFCDDDAMALEQHVLNRLARAAGANIADGSLTLLDSNGDVLLEFDTKGLPGIDGDWVVNGLHFPAREAIMSVHGELNLHIEGDEVSGSAGCNMFSGTLRLDDDGVAIGPLMSTRRFCGDDEGHEGPSTMEQEAAYLAALENTAEVLVEGDRLTLLRPDGGISATLHRA